MHSEYKPCSLPPQEIELQARRDQFRVEEVRQRQILEKRQLPKKLKTEHKAAVAELRKAIRQKKVLVHVHVCVCVVHAGQVANALD